MDDKRKKFELIINPFLELEETAVFENLLFYPAEELPEGSQVLDSLVNPDSLYDDDSEARQHYDTTFGVGGWAITPHIKKDGEWDGLVDIVSAVDPERYERMYGHARELEESIGRPALRLVRAEDEIDPLAPD